MCVPPQSLVHNTYYSPNNNEGEMIDITTPPERNEPQGPGSAVGMNEPKETPPAVPNTSHSTNEIEVVEVMPPTEPSSTPVPYAASNITVTPPE